MTRNRRRYTTATFSSGSGIPSPSSSGDYMPCGHKKGKRNLIVCIDGTANQFGIKNTNVIELYNLIQKEDQYDQLTWYNSGIGTYARPSWKSLRYYLQIIEYLIDLAIAWNFDRTVLAAYQWLSDNYQDGDCIYLFGFSRGAFQVRVLAAMIDKVGLIYKGNEMQIPFAYELYCDPESDKPSSLVTRVGSSEPPKTISWFQRLKNWFHPKYEEARTTESVSMAERFKGTFSRKDVKVHFVGAWDTVSSIGIMRGTRMLPHTVDGMKHVCHFRHALALDERRVKFLPEYAYGGSANPSTEQDEHDSKDTNEELSHDDRESTTRIVDNIQGEENTTPITFPPESLPTTANESPKADLKSIQQPTHTLEVWFAGTHSDIGGGNVDNPAMDRSRPPLRWMIFEAGSLGLRTAQFDRILPPDEQIEVQESLTPIWWLLELVFFRRLTYTRRNDGNKITYKPHLWASRNIHHGQKIHSSLTLSNKTDYTPRARPPLDDPNLWENVRNGKGLGKWQVDDLDVFVKALVRQIVNEGNGAVWKPLHQIAISGDGRQAVYEEVLNVLQNNSPDEFKMLLLKGAIEILKSSEQETSLKLHRLRDVRDSMAHIWNGNNKEYQEIAQQFVTKFIDFRPLILDGHKNVVTSVEFSPDGAYVVSGSLDLTIRLWDAEKGTQIGEPFQGHTGSVRSVAFSPDGKQMVSGSYDCTIRLWDVTAGVHIGQVLQGHTDWVRSVAFSPDGKHIVSVSDDKTIRIWDVEKQMQIGDPFRGHTDYIVSVSFSPDGKKVISGSADRTIRLWDVRTGLQIGEALEGHRDWVWSVAFSPDGKHIVSGSDDKTIRIWDVEKQTQIGEPFRGDTNDVNSVAFAPDGKRVVSGSADETVRMWDADTGEQIGESFTGHTAPVWSVAFSPDGKKVVSGSYDRTVRIWGVVKPWEIVVGAI